ncbi:MAG: hypothetical protein OEW12_04890 [Deltaproteobacteria bacterium]|nr:hypothetical protein [Deltaproteobacteria bacterium]
MAAALFFFFGTLTALWKTPLTDLTGFRFVRMTPLTGWELPLLALESLLLGGYLALRATPCAVKKAGFGGLLGFLGFACPACNKILMLVFGAGVLQTWFEPIQPLVGAIGIGLLAMALGQKFVLRRRFQQPAPPAFCPPLEKP